QGQCQVEAGLPDPQGLLASSATEDAATDDATQDGPQDGPRKEEKWQSPSKENDQSLSFDDEVEALTRLINEDKELLLVHDMRLTHTLMRDEDTAVSVLLPSKDTSREDTKEEGHEEKDPWIRILEDTSDNGDRGRSFDKQVAQSNSGILWWLIQKAFLNIVGPAFEEWWFSLDR
ncbi:unnamed protein product, partial [Amoebophrya sp. A25]